MNYDFSKWFKFVISRSSGPGGQNVNKVNSQVELHFNYLICTLLSDGEKQTISIKLKNKINSKNEIVVSRQTYRSQLKNKESAITAMYKLIENALKKEKKRKKTVPTINSKENRLDNKKKNSQKKSNRKKMSNSDY